MKINTKILLTTLLFSSQLLLAQQGKLDEANEKYEEHAYINAAEIYREVAEAGFESEELLEKLGNSYYFNALYEDAAHWYGRLFESGDYREPVYTLRYAQSLKASGRLQESRKYFDLYKEASGKTGEGSDIDFQKLLKENSGRYGIESLKINSAGIDFSAASGPNGELVFASTRDTGVVRRSLSAWDGLSFLDLYLAPNPKTSARTNKVKGDINTRSHESSPVFAKDGNMVYFTRSRVENPKGENNTSNLEIYRAQLVDGQWTEIESLSINSPGFSNAHPALSSDERTLFFSSDRPGGFGQSDIYSVEILEDGSFGEPKNLGDQVNTLGRETFPFVSAADILYFSSDGHVGFGALDVFYWDPQDKLTKFPINLGAPLNSPADDLAFSLDPEGSGYFSSNRPGGKGHDDIYAFTEQKPIKQVHQATVSGKVVDRETGEPLANSRISVQDPDNNEVTSLITDSEGNYQLLATRFSAFNIRAENENYYTDEKPGEPQKQVQEINFNLEQNIFKVYQGEDLTKALGIETIYFDLDKEFIRPDAAVELEKVYVVMQQYPEIKIEVRSHTDSRASEQYNLELSERRAKATVDYLVQKGISPERLSSKGFGETEPRNKCTDGTPCTEEQHQQNRRSEFILVDF